MRAPPAEVVRRKVAQNKAQERGCEAGVLIAAKRDAFFTTAAPSMQVKLAGTAPFAKAVIVKDDKYVYSVAPKESNVDFTWRDNAAVPGKASYYYVRGGTTGWRTGVGLPNVDHLYG